VDQPEAVEHEYNAITIPANVSNWPVELTSLESQLLDLYIQRFSRTYPTCQGPENPFLSILLPLSKQSRVVLDSLLALSAVQSWQNDAFEMEQAMLQLQQRAIRGCIGLLKRLCEVTDLSSLNDDELSTSSIDDILALLASCVSLLLFEKLSSGNQVAAMPHLQFFARYLPQPTSTMQNRPWSEAFRFLSSLFVYNDLVRATSNRSPTLSAFYLHSMTSSLPNILARCSAGDLSVTDDEIAAWDGRLDWFPSFSLLSTPLVLQSDFYGRIPIANNDYVSNFRFCIITSFACPSVWSQENLVSELYRIAATVYRKQAVRAHYMQSKISHYGQSSNLNFQMGNLPLWAIELLRLIPSGSSWENCLLFPIGIIARELDGQLGREYVTTRLGELESRFRIRLYSLLRERLVEVWRMRDRGVWDLDNRSELLCG
jgi:hypothetical protein